MSNFRYRASLALNVILAASALVLALHKPQPAPAPPTATDGTESSSAPQALGQARSPHFAESASPAEQRRWLIDELRAMGVPNKILARIVQADLDANWTKHAAELTLKCHGDPDTMAALQLDIDASHDADMRAALGEEGFKQWDHENMLRETDQGKVQLTAAETATAYDAWKKLQQRELELRQAKSRGEMDDADVADAHDKAYAEFTQQMKSLLGDERYAKSQQTDPDSAAAGLRQDFAKAEPTDAQFQQLLQTQQQWNDQRAALDKQFQDNQSSAAYESQIKALDDARDAEYQRVLGTNVFSALQKEEDPGYTKMKKYETIWGLDDNSIDSIYGTMQYYQKSVSDYQSQARALEAQGQTVDWNAINKNLQQFAQQTQQSLQNYLGADRFTRLQQNGVLQFNQNQFSYNR
ncbi:MAG TPA: hypothetical protein VHC44_16670 [Verrucomicrobiae bacterium]|nr:hypothetical protein [Verrucomicrobiae bacterium]